MDRKYILILNATTIVGKIGVEAPKYQTWKHKKVGREHLTIKQRQKSEKYFITFTVEYHLAPQDI
jgi:hypothetical protein